MGELIGNIDKLNIKDNNDLPWYIYNKTDLPLKKSTMTLEERYNSCLKVGAECIQEEELNKLLANKEHPICYDGFEPSGRMHIAQGVLKAINVNKLTSAGCVFVFWVADWFAMLNNKLDGDLEKIKIVGQYFIEIWKAAGMDMTNVRFLWASEEINRNPDKYWITVMDIARKNNISRIKRCCKIMGRQESDEMSSASILYPCMQCADIFYLKADICQLGLDQRKVNVLAREYCDHIGKKDKPIILSHAMMPGLLEGQEKMSKSDPSSAIFVEDTYQDIKKKIKKAYCPPNIIDPNPCITYVTSIIFPKLGEFLVPRKEQYGGDILYKDINKLKEDYISGELHPGDLKSGLVEALNAILTPIRDHFENDEFAKDLLLKIKFFQINK